MVKKSDEQLNEDEIKILTELQYNGKENIEAIAKCCGFSSQKVRRIIKQLEDRHIIWGYTAVNDTRKMNNDQFMICIKRNMKPLDNEVINKISNINFEKFSHPLGLHIVCSYYVHGTYDWVIVCTGDNLRHARKLCDVLNTEFPGYIDHIDIQQILYTHRKHYIINPKLERIQNLLK
jgi:DNA-binding Lrp family transcriptional regulator